MPEEPTNRPPLAAVGVAFLRIGAVAFGGLGAALSIIQRDAVERRGWLTQGDITDALAFTKPLPGSTVVQVVAFVGWRLHGWSGALVAAVAFLTPSVFLMVAAAGAVVSLPDAPWVSGALTGVQVAVVGVLAQAAWALARDGVRSRGLLFALVVGLAMGFVVNAALVVVALGAIGTVLSRGERENA